MVAKRHFFPFTVHTQAWLIHGINIEVCTFTSSELQLQKFVFRAHQGLSRIVSTPPHLCSDAAARVARAGAL